MKCLAYIKDGELNVSFNQSSMVFSKLQYPVGDGGANFSSFPAKVYSSMFGQFRAEFLLSIENGESDAELLDTLSEYVHELSDMNPYFNFYMDVYMFCLLCLRTQGVDIAKILREFVFVGENLNMDDVDFTDVAEASLLVAGILVSDVETRQAWLKEDFDAITSSAEEFRDFSPMQRLYLLSKQGRNYLSGKFKTSLMADFAPIPEDFDEIKTTLLAHKVDVVEMIEINTLDDMLSFELYHTLKLELPLRKCKFCGGYFIVRGRSDTEYCDRQKPGEAKPCSVIGATRTYWDSKADDPIYREFQKAYKRNHSRRRAGTMTQTEFFEWSDEAGKKRDACLVGDLAFDEFVVWLEQGRRKARG